MTGRVIAIVAVLALIAAASVVVAQGPRMGAGRGMAAGPGGPGMCGMGAGFGLAPRIAAELGLSDAQAAQLNQIQQDFAATTEALRTQLAAEGRKMSELWAAPQPDANAIKAQAAAMDALRADLRNIGIDFATARLNVLTPAQREKLQSTTNGFGMGRGFGAFCGPGFGAKGAGPRMGRGPGMGLAPRDGTGPMGGTPYCPQTN